MISITRLIARYYPRTYLALSIVNTMLEISLIVGALQTLSQADG